MSPLQPADAKILNFRFDRELLDSLRTKAGGLSVPPEPGLLPYVKRWALRGPVVKDSITSVLADTDGYSLHPPCLPECMHAS